MPSNDGAMKCQVMEVVMCSTLRQFGLERMAHNEITRRIYMNKVDDAGARRSAKWEGTAIQQTPCFSACWIKILFFFFMIMCWCDGMYGSLNGSKTGTHSLQKWPWCGDH